MDQHTSEVVKMMDARLHETVREEPWFAEELGRLCVLHLQRFSAACSQLHRDTEEHMTAVKDLAAMVAGGADNTRERSLLPARLRARRFQIAATVESFNIRTMNYLAPNAAWLAYVDKELRTYDANLREGALQGAIPELEHCMKTLDGALDVLKQKGASHA